MTPVRSVSVLLLALTALALLQSASATHFRYGYMYWERDLSFASSTQAKVSVVMEAGGRWTYTAWNAASSQGISPTVCPTPTNPSACCAGVVSNYAANTFTSLSCPPVGGLVNFAGGVTNGLSFTKAFTITKRHGVTLTTQIVSPTTCTCTNPAAVPPGCTCTLPSDVIIFQTVPVQDTMYGRLTFDMVVALSDVTNGQVQSIWWANSNRISELRDSNNDISWRIGLLVNLGIPASSIVYTKSPRTTSGAVINVFTGQSNQIDFPTSSFDNLLNKFRLATNAESLLSFASPLSPSIFSLNTNTGRVTFTPTANGFYALQLIIVSYNPNTGTESNYVPLDFMFNAVTSSGTTSVTIATSDGAIEYQATVNQLHQHTVRATMSPFNTAYTTTITVTGLPVGSFTTGGTCTGVAICPITFNWTPTVTSAAAPLSYTATITSGQVFIAQTTGSLAVTVKLAPLVTQMFAAASSGFCGGRTLMSAKLIRVIDLAALPLRAIVFRTQGFPTTELCSDPNNLSNFITPLTNSSGWADCEYYPPNPFPSPGNPYTATFNAVAGELVQSSQDSNVIVTKVATVTVDAPVFSNPSIDYPLTVSAHLNRVFTDGVTQVPVGTQVEFLLTGPGTSVTMTVGTVFGNIATATFAANPLTGPGPWTVRATFYGNGCLFPNADGSPAFNQGSATALRRTKLVFTAVTAPPCGTSTTAVPIAVTVSLLQLPSLTVAMVGQSVSVDYGLNAVPASLAGTTDSNGVVSSNVYWTAPTSGPSAKVVTATYTPIAGYANDVGAAAAETETLSILVTNAPTIIVENLIPTAATVGESYTASAILRRNVALISGIAGSTLTFTFRTPTNGLAGSRTGGTDSNGLASMASAFVIPATMTGSSTLTISTGAPAGGCQSAPTALVIPLTISSVPSTLINAQPITAVCGIQQTASVPVTDNALVALPNLAGMSWSNPASATCTSLSQTSGGLTGTNFLGIFSCTFTPTTTIASSTYTVSYNGAGGRQPTSDQNTFSVRQAVTSLAVSSPTGATTYNLGGGAVSFVAQLSTNEGSLVAVGAGLPVRFVVTLPGGSTSQGTPSTASDGRATLSFTPTVPGVHSVTAVFEGTVCLGAATQVSFPSLTVYQPVKLTLSPNTVSSICRTDTGPTITALLQTPANGVPLAPGNVNVPVVLSYGNTGLVSYTSTSANSYFLAVPAGFATPVANLPTAAQVGGTAANGLFLVPSPSGALATDIVAPAGQLSISQAVTSLSFVSVPSSSTVGATLSATVELQRLSTPSGFLSGQTVTFTLTAPGGGTTNFDAVTDTNGQATGSFTNVAVAGSYSINAVFNPPLPFPTTQPTWRACHASSSTGPQSVTVTSNLLIVLTPVVPQGVCGDAFYFNAQVTTQPDGLLVTDPLVVTVTADGRTCTGTIVNGLASCFITFPGYSLATLSAVANIAAQGVYSDTSSAPATFLINSAATSLDALTITGLDFVGQTVTVATQLNRDANPAAALSAPVSFSFQLQGSALPPTVLPTTSDGNGDASVIFSLTTRGKFHITVTYAGDTCNAAASRLADFTVFQKVALLANAAHGVCTDSTPVEAVLTAIPGGAGVSGQTVSFDFGGVVPSGTGTTDSNGVARLDVIYALPGTYPLTATFENLADYFVDDLGNPTPSSSTTTVTITSITTLLTAPIISVFQEVGSNLAYYTVLTRLNPTTANLAGKVVSFFIDANQQTQTATTNSNGEAHVTFTVNSRGVHTIDATFAGDLCLIGSHATAPFDARQRARLTLNQPVAAVCGVPTDITGTLVTLPGSLAVSPSQSIAFSAAGGSPSSGSVSTNGAGVATFTTTYGSFGSKSVIGTFAADQNFFLNRNGLIAVETDTFSATVNRAVSQLSAVTASGQGFVGVAMTFSATLTRFTGPSGPAAGDVSFAVTAPGGAVTDLSGTALVSDGIATVTYTPLVRGVYSVLASFAGDSCLDVATSSVFTTEVYQKSAVTASVIGSAVCGIATQVRALLTTVPGNTALVEGKIIFSTSVPGVGPTTVNVVAGGIATTSFVFPSAATVSIVATFDPTGVPFSADRNGVLNTGDIDSSSLSSVPVSAVLGTFGGTLVVAGGNGHIFIGDTITVTSTLTRADNGNPLSGASVVYTVTEPDGTPVVLTGVPTSGAGVSSQTFVASKRGEHEIVASYAGSSCITTPVASNGVQVLAYQKTRLVVPATQVSASCNAPLTFSVTLETVPGGLPIESKQINFIFFTAGDGQLANADAGTSAAGVATTTQSFAKAQTVNVNVRFTDAANYYADSTGAFPIVPTDSATTVLVTAAATSLSLLTVPATTFIGDATVVSVVLTRDIAPIGPAANEIIHFTVTDPNTLTTLSGDATTDPTGKATFSFITTKRGTHTVSASFALGECLLPSSTSASRSTDSYQRVALSLPAPGTLSTLCSAPLTVVAHLINVPANTPASGLPVDIQFTAANGEEAVDDGAGALTDLNGDATTNPVIPHSNNNGVTWSPVTAVASFSGQYYSGVDAVTVGGPATATTTIIVNNRVATLSQPAVASAVVAGAVVYSTTLSSATAPAPLLVAVPVLFELYNEATPSTIEASTTLNTGPGGLVSASLTATTKGVHRVRVSIVRQSCLTSADATSDAFNVYQRVSLAVASASVTCEPTDTSSLVATLLAVPGNAPISGESISFAFTGTQAGSGASLSQPTRSATTIGDGTATLTGVVFPLSGTVQITTTFFNEPNFYTDNAGSLPPVAQTATNDVTVAVAQTLLTVGPLPDPAYFVDSPLPVFTVTLTRNTAPFYPLANLPLTVTDANGGLTFSGNTDTNGVLSFTLNSLVPAHTYILTVAYSPVNPQCLQPSSNTRPQFDVWVPALLTLTPTPPSVTCGLSQVSVRGLVSNIPAIGFMSPLGNVLMSVSGPGTTTFVSSTGLVPGENANLPSTAVFSSTFSLPGTYVLTGTYVVDTFHTNSLHAHPPANEVATTSVTVTKQLPRFVNAPHLTTGNTALVGDWLDLSVQMERDDHGLLDQILTFTFTGPQGQTRTYPNVFGDPVSGIFTIQFKLWDRGVWQVTAVAADAPCLSLATSPVGSFTLYQRVEVVLDAPTQLTTCGNPTDLKALLVPQPALDTFFPEDTVPRVMDGIQVQYDFNTPLLSSATRVSSGGFALYSVIFPDGINVNFAATVVDADLAFITDVNGLVPVIPPSNGQTVLSASITTELSITGFPEATLVGDMFHVEATLTQLPTAAVTGGLVHFVLTSLKDSTFTDLSTTTNGLGVAGVDFDGSLLARGAYELTATFARSGCLSDSVATAQTVTLYQRTQLAHGVVNPVCGADFLMTATLTNLPSGSGIEGQNVDFDFGSFSFLGDALTDVDGITSHLTRLDNAGDYPVTSHFDNTDFYTNHLGDLPIAPATSVPEELTNTITVTPASATLDTPTVVNAQWYITDTLNVRSLLKRAAITPPTDGVVGVAVEFTLTRNDNGQVVNTVTATTVAFGEVIAQFDPNLDWAVTTYSIQARYLGDGCIQPVDSLIGTATMRQRTTLTINTSPSVCGFNTLVKATITPQSSQNPAPLNGLSIVFTSGPVAPTATATCTGTTVLNGANYEATCLMMLTNSGPNFFRANFAGFGINEASNRQITISNAVPGASTLTNDLTTQFVAPTPPALAYPQLPLANGRFPVLRAKLVGPNSPGLPVVGRTISFTIGAGGSAQSCTGQTDINGIATCSTPTVLSQANAKDIQLQLSFPTGDSCFAQSSVTGHRVLAYNWLPTQGAFVVSDNGGTGANKVYLGTNAQWKADNPLTFASDPDTPPNSAFNGFTNDFRTKTGAVMAVSSNSVACLTGSVTSSNNPYWNAKANIATTANLPAALTGINYMGVYVTPTLAYNPAATTANPSTDCGSNPCLNGGTCLPSYGSGYYCVCPSTPPPGRTGKNCELTGAPTALVGAGARPHGSQDPAESTGYAKAIGVMLVQTYNPPTVAGQLPSTQSRGNVLFNNHCPA